MASVLQIIPLTEWNCYTQPTTQLLLLTRVLDAKKGRKGASSRESSNPLILRHGPSARRAMWPGLSFASKQSPRQDISRQLYEGKHSPFFFLFLFLSFDGSYSQDGDQWR